MLRLLARLETKKGQKGIYLRRWAAQKIYQSLFAGDRKGTMFGNVAVACEPPNRVDLISLHICCARRIFSSFQFLISFVYIMVMCAV